MHLASMYRTIPAPAPDVTGRIQDPLQCVVAVQTSAHCLSDSAIRQNSQALARLHAAALVSRMAFISMLIRNLARIIFQRPPQTMALAMVTNPCYLPTTAVQSRECSASLRTAVRLATIRYSSIQVLQFTPQNALWSHAYSLSTALWVRLMAQVVKV